MPPGAEGVKQIVDAFRAAFPDLQITIEELVAEGDKVCARSTMRGTHRGVLFGVAPTGKAVAMAGLTMVTIVDGRLIESYVRNDVAGLISQIGAGAPSRRREALTTELAQVMVCVEIAQRRHAASDIEDRTRISASGLLASVVMRSDRLQLGRSAANATGCVPPTS